MAAESNGYWTNVDGKPTYVEPGSRMNEDAPYDVDAVLGRFADTSNMIKSIDETNNVYPGYSDIAAYSSANPDEFDARYEYLKSQGFTDKDAYAYMADEWRNMTPQRKWSKKNSGADGALGFAKFFVPRVGAIYDFAKGDKEGIEEGISTFFFQNLGLPWMAVEAVANVPAYLKGKANIQKTNEGIRRNNAYFAQNDLDNMSQDDVNKEIRTLHEMADGDYDNFDPESFPYQEEYEEPSFVTDYLTNAAVNVLFSKMGNKLNNVKAFKARKKGGEILPKMTKQQKASVKAQDMLNERVRKDQLAELRQKARTTGLDERDRELMNRLLHGYRGSIATPGSNVPTAEAEVVETILNGKARR